MEFRGQYSFLSNFYLSPIEFCGVEFPALENAYQAGKHLDVETLHRFSDITPADAKRLGRLLNVTTDNWDSYKVKLMEHLIHIKFSSITLREKLIEVDIPIVGGNTWHDNFWGHCLCDKCKNKTHYNVLGELIQKERERILNGYSQR